MRGDLALIVKQQTDTTFDIKLTPMSNALSLGGLNDKWVYLITAGTAVITATETYPSYGLDSRHGFFLKNYGLAYRYN